MVNKEGLTHVPLFTIACVVFEYRETGKLEVCVALFIEGVFVRCIISEFRDFESACVTK